MDNNLQKTIILLIYTRNYTRAPRAFRFLQETMPTKGAWSLLARASSCRIAFPARRQTIFTSRRTGHTHSSAYPGVVRDREMVARTCNKPSEVLQKTHGDRLKQKKIRCKCVRRKTPQSGVSSCSSRTRQTLRTQATGKC